MQIVHAGAAVLLVLIPSLLHGAVIEFTDRASWLAAVGTVTNIGFEGIAPAGGSTKFNSLTLSGVQFSSPVTGGLPGVLAVSAGLDYVNAWGSGDKLQSGTPNELDIALPDGVTAIGTDIMSTSTFFIPFDATYTATLSTGETFNNIFASRPTSRSFIGFISTTPITSLRLVTGSTFPMIDNFAFNGASTAVPEPASFLLIGFGLFGVFVLFAPFRKTT